MRVVPVDSEEINARSIYQVWECYRVSDPNKVTICDCRLF
jgi:hypothetical protein